MVSRQLKKLKVVAFFIGKWGAGTGYAAIEAVVSPIGNPIGFVSGLTREC